LKFLSKFLSRFLSGFLLKSRRFTRGVLLLFATLSILAALSGSAVAQTTGEIRGIVKDATGAAVPGAMLTARLADTNAARWTTSSNAGEFGFAELPVGNYSLTASAPGFAESDTPGVEVQLGHVTRLDVELKLGTRQETVVVHADTAAVETQSTQLGAVMTQTAVRELPLITRDTYQLLQLQPGVQSQLGADLFYGSADPGVVSVNGGRGRSNNYMVNGGDGNDLFVNSPSIEPSPDTIQEFRVLTSAFDAEFGRNSGSAVNVVTKAGTNHLHGDLYEFFRNQAFDARGYFDPTVPQDGQNQFGSTLGGPLRKDRTFLFGSYEGNRLRQGTSSGNVLLPTQAEASGDFSEAGSFPSASPFTGTLIDPAFAHTLATRQTGGAAMNCQSAVVAEGGESFDPLPDAGMAYGSIFPGNKIPTACFDPTAAALYGLYVAPFGTGPTSTVPASSDRKDQFTQRLDHALSPNQEFSFYYFFDDDRRADPFATLEASGADVPGFGAIFGTRVQQWNLSHTWTIGAASVNEFRFTYFRSGQGEFGKPERLLPSVHDSCGAALAATCFTDPSNPTAGITSNVPGYQGVPAVNVYGGFAMGNNSIGQMPQAGNTFQGADTFTKVVRAHTLKWGADIRRQQFNQFSYFNLNGNFSIISNANLCSPFNPNPPAPVVPSSGVNCTVPTSNDVGFASAYPNYFLGLSSVFTEGSAQGQDDRSTSDYLFAQDSWTIRPSVTVNYGLRWELNTPFYDTGNRLQTFRPGEATTQYPCWMSEESAAASGLPAGNCAPGSAGAAVFPLGLMFPGSAGVPRGLTTTQYRAFAPRIGVAWSPQAQQGWLAKLSGGPAKSSIRAAYGIFYNPIEQLVLQQFSAEPPFGGSVSLSNTLLNLPFEPQSGGAPYPNVFAGIMNPTPHTPCASDVAGGPPGCVDWASFRPILLFGEFGANLHTQYSEQYNLTIERQLPAAMVLRISYVGTEGHHLLATHDLGPGNSQTCLDLQSISTYYAVQLPSGAPNPNANAQLSAAYSCGPFDADSAYSLPAGSIPSGYTVHLPYGNVAQVAGSAAAPNPALTLDGLRPYSSPICQPEGGAGCPPDGVPVFSNIFAEDTIANSNYNALQVSVERNLSESLLFQASYTFGKAIDQGASFEDELNPLNFRATRGLSLLDARQRFVFSPYWELPLHAHHAAPASMAARITPRIAARMMEDGWGVAAIVMVQTGFPIRTQTQDDLELESSSFFEDANTPEIAGRVRFLNPRTSGGYWFDTSNISDPAPGTFGNMPHALCCGPALNNTDLAIVKKTAVDERWTTEFRIELFNAWNHTQFENPDGNFSDLSFGLVQKARGARTLQLALKAFF
jgi:hypothetical protein